MIYEPLFPYRLYGGCDVDDRTLELMEHRMMVVELGEFTGISDTEVSYPPIRAEIHGKLKEIQSPLSMLFDDSKTMFTTMECDELYEWYLSKRDCLTEEAIPMFDRFMSRFDIARMNDGVVRRCFHSE